ncbi:MAG: hypothetical protein RR194_03075, partial [Ruthenibacterium sp.]
RKCAKLLHRNKSGEHERFWLSMLLTLFRTHYDTHSHGFQQKHKLFNSRRVENSVETAENKAKR